MSASPIMKNQLKKIANDTAANGFGTIKQEQVSRLGAFIEVNQGAGVSPEGLVQVRLTAAGSAEIDAPVVPRAKLQIAVATGGALPQKTRAATAGHSVYPFEDLAAPTTGADGQPSYSYFTVLDSELGKDAFKAISSTVSSANTRYVETSEPVLNADGSAKIGRGGHPETTKTYSRKFEAFRVGEGESKGVAVYRVK